MSTEVWLFVLVIAVCAVAVCKPVRKRIALAVCWVFGMFGYKDKSKWGVVIKRVWGTCLVVCVCVLTCLFVFHFLDYVLVQTGIYHPQWYYREKIVSNDISFFGSTDGKGEIRTNYTDKVLIRNVNWVSVPEGGDSLAVFASNKKRGYFNKFTGEVVIPAVYDRAWQFSEGIAGVVKDNSLMFINPDGSLAFDGAFNADLTMPAYLFENGYCLVRSNHGNAIGMIDHQGNWALQPIYENIQYEGNGSWKVEKEDNEGLVNDKMELVMPIEYTSIDVSQEGIYSLHPQDNGMMKLYDFDGKTVLNPTVISDVYQLYYETDKKDEDNEYIREHATLRYYLSYPFSNKMGLITVDGKIITNPIYEDIEAIGKDLYLCTPQGVVLDSSGEMVKAR